MTVHYHLVSRSRMTELYILSIKRLHGMVLNYAEGYICFALGIVLPRIMCETLYGGLDWILDLLSSLIHDS
jgi:hypothetical protein